MSKKTKSEKEIVSDASDTMTDAPVKITIGIIPQNFKEKALMWLKIMPRKKIFIINGATLGTMIRVSKLLLSLNYSPKPKEANGMLPWAYDLIVSNGDICAKIIATAIHNKRSEHPEELETMIYDNYEAKDLRKVAIGVVNKLDVFAFTDTITLIRPMTIMTEVSQIPDEIIAPDQLINGEGLEMLSNIFASVTKA